MTCRARTNDHPPPPFRTKLARPFGGAAILSIVVAAGCVSVPLRVDPEIRTLVIENPDRRPIRLERAGRGAIGLGTESLIEVPLEVDRSVVHDGRVGRPAPLIADRDRIEVVPTGRPGRRHRFPGRA